MTTIVMSLLYYEPHISSAISKTAACKKVPAIFFSSTSCFRSKIFGVGPPLTQESSPRRQKKEANKKEFLQAHSNGKCGLM
jgi:hypothetical protein